MFESVFTFLFKYERLIFEQGQFVLGATRSMWLFAAAASVAALYVLWTYLQLGSLRTRDRAVLFALRLVLVLVALFAILRPTLLLKVAVPQQNFVGIVLDDSLSMQIPDEQAKARSQWVVDQLGRPDGPLLTALGKRFVPRVFRFSSSAERLQSTSDLSFQGTGTRLGDALDRTRDEMSGLPVAGIILVTDGADNAEATLDQSIAGLKAQGIPVFSVGVGKERLTRDVQVTRAETPRRALKGASLVVDVVVTQTGYGGAKVPLVVEDGGRIVSTQDITLPPDGESQTVKVRFKASEVGPRQFRFRVPVQTGEEVAQNNQRDVLIDVYNRREKVLFLDGEPRFEPKFIKQATDGDDNLSVSLLQRTAEATVSAPDKYLRLGVDGPEELQNGFPQTREELYGYTGIILGSVEAAAFSPDQQRMLEDFVNVRGGGLLALGGDRAFSEGGWAGTPLSDTLPITLDRTQSKPVSPPIELVVTPTQAGLSHPATQITDKEQDAAAKWRDLPPVFAVNLAPLSSLKPGASPLLSGVDARGRQQVVLAYQRYGRGKTLVLPVQDTWLWRMHAKMAVEDVTHHTFWQRLVRWLVDGVPERVMVTAAPARVQKGEPLALTAQVVDGEYKGVNDGRITAHATAPSGKVEDVAMEWSVEHEGEYRATFTPSENGVYKISVDGTSRAGKDLGRGTVNVPVAPSDAEYFDAAMRAPLLQRVAEETDGRFFKAADTSTLVDAITYSGKGITVVEERELWDMPIMLFLLLGLMGSEWMYRRTRGLA
ncbi:MAG: VWA domain-containing protein [Acidobacteriota bacterium]